MDDDHCRINGYFKEDSSPEECHDLCYDDPYCTGYAIQDDEPNDPGHCFKYGNYDNLFSANYHSAYLGWDTYTYNYFLPSATKTNGVQKVKCFRRTNQLPPKTIRGMRKNS